MLIYCTWALRFSDTGLTLEAGIVSCIYNTHNAVDKCHFLVATIFLIMLLKTQLPGLFNVNSPTAARPPKSSVQSFKLVLALRHTASRAVQMVWWNDVAWWYRETPGRVGAQEGELVRQLHQARSSKGCCVEASDSPAWVAPSSYQLGIDKSLARGLQVCHLGREGKAGMRMERASRQSSWALKATEGCRLLFQGCQVALGGEVYSRAGSQERLRVGTCWPQADGLLMTGKRVISGIRLEQKKHLGIYERWLRREKSPLTHMWRTEGTLFWAHFPKIVSTFKGWRFVTTSNI